MAPNFYEVLEIQKTASQEEVRKAYKKKALETHPDKAVSPEKVKELAAAKFRDVHEAFQVLNDPYQRRAYDIRIKINSDVPTKSPVQFDEEHIALMKDREEWARQATQRRKERIKVLDEARKARDTSRKTQEDHQKQEYSYGYKEILDQMLGNLYRLNPEWEIRKEQVHRRKAKREQAKAGA